jgi:hypothetical protein
MMRKFAVALIATTMLVAPALAADAVKSTPAAAATTAAPTDTSAAKSDTKTVTKPDKHLKTVKAAHRHHMRHVTVAKNDKHSSHVKAVKAPEPVNPAATVGSTVTKTDAASKPAVKTIKADKHLKKRHPTVAKNGKHSSHVKTAKVSKPGKQITVGKAPGEAAHAVKSNKDIAN